MKNSGIEWIGNIPDSWSLSRLQWHLSEVKESNDPVKTTQVLSLTNKLGVIPYEEKGDHGNKAKENLNEYKLAYPGTIVANSMNILIGSVGKCDYFGCVSPVYYVFKPNDGENIDFLNYVFQTEQFQKELRKYANGILEIRLRVSASDILKREIAFPSIEQQKKIVHFLNTKTSEIDSLINVINNQISHLSEYRQSIIDELMITDRCEKWKVKYLTDGISDGTHGSYDRVQEGHLLLSAKNLSENGLVISDNESMVSEADYLEITKSGYPRRNDILMIAVGDIGKTMLYEEDEVIAFQRSVMFIRPNHLVNPKYLLYGLKTNYVKLQEMRMMNKTIQAGLYQGLIKEIFVPFVRSLSEQEAIVKEIETKIALVDDLIKTKTSKINELNLYKKSLVYEYITGKKEVA